MEFTHTEDRRMLADSLSRFLRDKYPIETRHAAAASEQGFSREIWEGLAELGVLGAMFTEEEGGFGGMDFDIAVTFEELGRALVVEPVLPTTLLGGGLISALGDDAQKAQLEDVIDGGRLLALAHAEPTGRYDLSHVATRAEGGKLTGRKAVALNADSADAIIVSARTSGGDDDEDGISLFIVDPSADGLEIHAAPSVDGGRVADLTLTNVAATPLGPEGGAYPEIERAHARANVALCAEALGAMEAAKDLTLDYIKTRKQFGRPIGTFQVLQHRMAEMLIELEQARSAVINAAGHLEADRRTRERHVAACKNLIGRVGQLVAEESIQIHGGIGMTWEYAVGHYAKRITMIDHTFGDVDHHLERYIALGRP
jgi:alkylation response protein AidB-like acyl-CoA dehydrogenase